MRAGYARDATEQAWLERLAHKRAGDGGGAEECAAAGRAGGAAGAAGAQPLLEMVVALKDALLLDVLAVLLAVLLAASTYELQRVVFERPLALTIEYMTRDKRPHLSTASAPSSGCWRACWPTTPLMSCWSASTCGLRCLRTPVGSATVWHEKDDSEAGAAHAQDAKGALVFRCCGAGPHGAARNPPPGRRPMAPRSTAMPMDAGPCWCAG